ncbi:protein-methionine-sulfoxide reductase catalytic subunit MsrP [Methylophilaceae bacterium]|nr:protein-methionine-sulfoxide reductase catalytic subunit MsrP [Methylophilaceae bacterium]
MSSKNPIRPSEITPEHIYNDRRNFLKSIGIGLGATALSSLAFGKVQSLNNIVGSDLSVNDEKTSFKDITTYNNYYEFGTKKTDPSEYADKLTTDPWSVSIEGAVKKNKVLSVEDIIKLSKLEERVYRLRCVEGWSMVIPWVGIPLKSLLEHVSPTNNAKFVKFTTLNRPSEMIGQRYKVLDWPYIEGLRMDEAMHPLTILAVGLYGKVLPNQNGAPIRLVVPWKYGFKSTKAITKISLVEKMPETSWMKAGPSEYGFYANVNPNVDHPRWTQATERQIGKGLFAPRVKTKMFNGYEDEVGHMYKNMDLKKYF